MGACATVTQASLSPEPPHMAQLVSRVPSASGAEQSENSHRFLLFATPAPSSFGSKQSLRLNMSSTSPLRILLIGNGGREHTLAWKLSQSEKVESIHVVPGNGGTAG